MAIAFDANCSGVRTFDGGSALASDLSITVANNSTVAVFAAADSFGTAQAFTFTDGSAYTEITARGYDTASANRVAIFIRQGVSSGTKTISGTCTSGSYGRVWAASWTGCGTYVAADTPVTATGNSTTPDTGTSATLSQADMLILTAFAGNVTTWSGTPTLPPASGYSDLFNVTNNTYNPVAYAYKVVAATTAVSANIGTTASDHWGAVLCMIPAAPSGTGGKMPFTSPIFNSRVIR